ncbi:hypothetical protein FRC12_024426 [Ceratobasidium sp. 428]|nr:hypothetical protein FRC12_024426 [Ceratobasidium sp. 428]
MPRMSTNAAAATAARPSNSADEPRYQLRNVAYKYSHTQAPRVPSPKPPTERPPLPTSLAKKRRGPRSKKQTCHNPVLSKV